MKPLEQAGKFGAFLLQLTPSFSPSRHELDELGGLVEALDGRPLAIEFRHRGWVEDGRIEHTLEWLSEHGAAFVAVDAPKEVHVPIMPDVDAVTTPELAYIRLHGRNAEGYLKGKSVAERFGWDYSDAPSSRRWPSGRAAWRRTPASCTCCSTTTAAPTRPPRASSG